MSKRTACRVAAVWLFAAAVPSSAYADREGYVLGVGDHIRVKVVEWRATRGEPYEWPGLTGEFTVGSSGAVSLPMLGPVDAAGSSPVELGERVSLLLQKRVGLVQTPSTSIEVSQYRPFYIVGAVEKPGEYAYRPGMKLIEAVSIAGGLYRGPDARQRFERDSIVARGDLRILTSERKSLLAKLARLEAESRSASAINLPAELRDQSADSSVAEVIDGEQLLFQARRNALRSQTEGLDRVNELLQSEITTLQAKIASSARQSALNKTELDNVNALIAKGLAVSARKLTLEQNVAQFESADLDLRLAILRAKQDIGKTERSKQDIINQYQNDAAAEMNLTRAKLVENSSKRDTTMGLIYDAEVAGPRSETDRQDASAAAPTYEIARNSGSAQRVVSASEGDDLLPGDVIKVVAPKPASLSLRQVAKPDRLVSSVGREDTDPTRQ